MLLQFLTLDSAFFNALKDISASISLLFKSSVLSSSLLSNVLWGGIDIKSTTITIFGTASFFRSLFLQYSGSDKLFQVISTQRPADQVLVGSALQSHICGNQHRTFPAIIWHWEMLWCEFSHKWTPMDVQWSDESSDLKRSNAAVLMIEFLWAETLRLPND